MALGAIAAQIGVEAVVEGVAEFRRDLLDMSKSVAGFGERVGLLTRIFRAVTAPIGAFLGFLRDIAVVAGGVLMRDAILFLVGGIQSIIRETIQSGIEFQKLTVRLETLIARQILAGDRTRTFASALQEARGRAGDLFGEITKLALTSPFDIEDISNVFSLATSYGFAEDAALEVTGAVADFTAGMGLSNVEAERIIVNLGQMIQLGKVTQREMTDLARGAFVPVNDVLEIMAKNLGVTTDELAKMRLDGILPAAEFTKAFIQLVGEEFPDAAKRASRTLEGVTGNLKDLVQGILGFNVVRPILDAIAAPLADLIDVFAEDPRVVETAERLGVILAGMAENLLGFLPSAESLADLLITKFQILVDIIGAIAAGNIDVAIISFLNLLGLSSEQIVSTFLAIKNVLSAFETGGFLEGIKSLLSEIGAPDAVIVFVARIQAAFENLALFWDNNKDAILGIFDEILEAFGLEGGALGTSILDTVGEAIQNLSASLVTNGPAIVKVLEKIRDFIVDRLIPGIKDFIAFLKGEKGGAAQEFFTRLKNAVLIAAVIIGVLALALFGLAIILGIILSPLLLLGALFGFVVIEIFKFLGTLESMKLLAGLAFGILEQASTKGLGGVLTAIQESAPEIKERLAALWEEIKTGAVTAWEEKILPALEIAWEKIKEAAATFWENTFLPFLKGVWEDLKIAAAGKWEEIKVTIMGKIEEWKTAISEINWLQVGKNIVQGIVNGIKSVAGSVKIALLNMAKDAWQSVKDFFGSRSPSQLMAGLGESIVAGLVKGITGMANMPAIALTGVSAQATQAAASVVAAAPAIGAATNITNNNNLNINTSAPSEPIISDFQLLTSLNA